MFLYMGWDTCRAGCASVFQALLVSLLLVAPAAADPAPQLVKGWPAGGGSGGSHPSSITVVGDTVFFQAIDRSHGRELWRTDGTEAGTGLVKDINLGLVGSTSSSASPGPPRMAELDGVLYFVASDGALGDELWRSDGTAAGTELVADIRPGSSGSLIPDSPEHGAIVAIGDTLYFTASDGLGGRELWRSDGTAAGTRLVKDVNPGPAQSSPTILTAIGDVFYFTADDGVHGRELWRSDGTTAGTELVEDINPGTTSSRSADVTYGPSDLIRVGDVFYFTADDGVHGRELWRSDGTTAGTELVEDVNPGSASSNPPASGNPATSSSSAFAAVGDTVYFRADDGVHGVELWRSDGTAAGTELVTDIASGSVGADPRQVTAIDDVLYFGADDGVHGVELWRSDGTAAGTELVSDAHPGAGAAEPDGLTAVGDVLFFVADDGVHGRELWRSDGTAGGTVLLRDVGPGSSSEIAKLTAAGDALYFVASDGIHGRELWRSDGTAPGTRLVKDIDLSNSWTPANLADVSGTLFFSARAGEAGVELWRSDGTAAGTRLVEDINPAGSSSPSRAVELGGRAVFVANDGAHGVELWRSDGTEAGTELVKDVNPGSAGSSPSLLTAIGDALYFMADDGVHGIELWRSDGTAAGTELVEDIWPGSNGTVSPTSYYYGAVAAVGETLFFAADDGVHGAELWRSDGTEAGTELVKDIRTPDRWGADPFGFAVLDGRLYFAATEGPAGGSSSKRGLWRSDGTAAGTELVKALRPASLTAVGDELYFVTGRTLWRSDGSGDGTVAVGTYGQAISDPFGITGLRILTGLGDSVLLSQWVAGDLGCCAYERDLWRIDGATDSAAQLADVRYGAEPHLVRAGDGVYFRAWEQSTGYEIWRSNGTPEGTELLEDIVPGAGGSFPAELARAGDTLFFAAADDGAAAVGLWSLDTGPLRDPPAFPHPTAPPVEDDPPPGDPPAEPPSDDDKSSDGDQSRSGGVSSPEPLVDPGALGSPLPKGRRMAGRLVIDRLSWSQGRRLRLVARCADSATCAGTARVVMAGKRGSVLLAHGRYRIGPGAKRSIGLALGRRGRKLLARRERIRVRVVGAGIVPRAERDIHISPRRSSA